MKPIDPHFLEAQISIKKCVFLYVGLYTYTKTVAGAHNAVLQKAIFCATNYKYT